MVCKQITITGKVQGVYYRASAREKADELKLTGEVRNLPDGSVQVIVTGREEDILRFIEWCKVGPPHSRVAELIVIDMQVRQFEGFRIVRNSA